MQNQSNSTSKSERYFISGLDSMGELFGLFDRQAHDVNRNPFQITTGTREECLHIKQTLDKAPVKVS